MLEKDLQARMQLHHSLERMGCPGLMMSPLNLVGNNQIVMEIVGEMELEERWKKMPRGKPEEWTEAIITGTYKLKNGVDEYVVDSGYAE